jgi:hypothetical protein
VESGKWKARNQLAKFSSETNMNQTSQEQEHTLPGIVTRRKNGFERPIDPLQVSTWCLFPLILIHYYAFLYFLLWNDLSAKIILTFFFTVFAVLSAVSVAYTCAIDPADDVLCAPAKIPDRTDEQIYCYLCEIHVHSSSKHCRYCDKCVKRFDHHCKWLNTCIGEKNYVYFLAIVLFVFLLTVESFGLSLAFMIESFASPHQFHVRVLENRRFEHFLGSEISLLALQFILVFSVGILLILLLMLIQLGGFHIMLLWRGLTTYDFIIMEQKRARESEAEKAKRQVDRQQQEKSDHAIIAQAKSVSPPVDGGGGPENHSVVRSLEHNSPKYENVSRFSSQEMELVPNSQPEEKV